jgi:hypothetical protein
MLQIQLLPASNILSKEIKEMQIPLIGKSYTFTDPDSIAVGNTAPFELSSYPLELNPARYELQVQGT